ncbi:MAG: sulfotransferase [Burkholderiales bacterium]|nr:sulfotransferase [Burkholderiales bacterium]
MRRQTGYLFVISHMRSYSTLLTHILGSHPEIDGYAEQLRAYESRYDLSAMGPRIEQNTGERRKGRWLLDKILHNEGTMSDDVIRTPELRLLLLVRDPVTTIPSVVKVAREQANSPENIATTPEGAVSYYIDRLAGIVATGARAGSRALFVASESLVDDTDAALARIARWLGLASPLESRYRTFPLTGAPGLGDPSPNIRTGRVLADPEREAGSGERIRIDPAVLAPAIAAHREAVSLLRARHPG